MYKRELYLSKIRKFIDKKEIKVKTGIEKCGKTQLLKQIIDELKICKIASENIIYLSLKYNEIRNHLDLNKYIFKQIENLNGKLYLFFDEIQLVSNWKQSINEYTRNLNCDIYIASSNSKVLSKLANYVKIDVYPFSFSEILDYKRKQELFNSYLKYGGFPRILEFNDDEK